MLSMRTKGNWRPLTRIFIRHAARRRQCIALVTAMSITALLSWALWQSRSLSRSAGEGAVSRPADAKAFVAEGGGDEAEIEAVSVENARADLRYAVQSLADKATPTLAVVRGRFVIRGGEPAAAGFSLRGSAKDWSQALRSTEWVGVSGKSNKTGVFRVEFCPPAEFQFALEVWYEGHVSKWDLGLIDAGMSIDLGDVEIAGSGHIEGYIVNETGIALRNEAWTVYGDSDISLESSACQLMRATAKVDNAGAFHLGGVGAGRIHLKAYSPSAGWVDGPQIVMRSGEAFFANIVYRGPDSARRIALHFSADPFFTESPDPEYIRLFDVGDEVRLAQAMPRSFNAFTFDDLRPGSYRIAISDPRFLPWERTGVSPGACINAHLRGSSALHLRVTTTLNRAEDPGNWVVWVKFLSATMSHEAFELPFVEGGILRGFFPGDYHLRVQAGEVCSEVNVEDLTAGETRIVTVVLGD